MSCKIDVMRPNPIQQAWACFGEVKLKKGTSERARPLCECVHVQRTDAEKMCLTQYASRNYRHGMIWCHIISMRAMSSDECDLDSYLVFHNDSRCACVWARTGLNIHGLCAPCYEYGTLTAPHVLQWLIINVWACGCMWVAGRAGGAANRDSLLTSLFHDLDDITVCIIDQPAGIDLTSYGTANVRGKKINSRFLLLTGWLGSQWSRLALNCKQTSNEATSRGGLSIVWTTGLHCISWHTRCWPSATSQCCWGFMLFMYMCAFSLLTGLRQTGWKRTQFTTLLQQLAHCGEAQTSWLQSAVEFRSSRMKMYDYYSMEMQSKFICVLPTSL